jgi:protein-disulfide isomerase
MLRTRLPVFLLTLATAGALIVAVAAPAAAQSITPQQRSEIESIIRDYLIRNPEVLQEVARALEKRQAEADAARAQAAVKQHAELLFNSPRQVVLGNPRGDVTMVEFFDYNCGFCKRALGDMLTLMQEDPKLRVVLKEFPVLGQPSVEAAQVSIAVSLQDKSGDKFLEFHRRMLTGRGRVDKAQALAAAEEAGLDMRRIERDMDGPEVRAWLQESFKLAEALGLNGTPSYVIGENVVIGAVGVPALRENINLARCGKRTC